MALRAKIVSKIASSCNEGEGASEKLRGDGRRSIRARRVMEFGIARRGLLLSTVVAASQINTTNDSKTQLLQRYLKKTEENKAKNDKERLDSYYKRNYKDYFEFVEGSLGGKKDLSESEKGILDWLKSNR